MHLLTGTPCVLRRCIVVEGEGYARSAGKQSGKKGGGEGKKVLQSKKTVKGK